MFVIVIRSIGCKPFSLFSHKHKKIVNFIYSHLRFSTTCITNKKAHDYSRAFLFFLFCDTFEIVEISSGKKKSENAFY